MPVKQLPSQPSLDHLKYQAKDLLKAHAAHDPAAAQRIREFHSRFHRATDMEIFRTKFTLSDAQLTIARESGFASWPALKRRVEKPAPADNLNVPHHERIEDKIFRHAVDLLDGGDVDGLRTWLKQHPDLSRQRVVFEGGNYFRNPSLLEFVAENPIRRGTLPQNIVDVARVIVDAGVDQSALNMTLALVSTGRITRECGVQLPLIALLCDRGADPDNAVHGAALHGEFEAVNALLECGARMDLPVAAALGLAQDARQILPDSCSHDRQLALTLAAMFGHAEIVRLLLDAGEDANRYNPVGAHAHSTPLHQAALAGHENVVRLLIEHGARLDLKDTLWQGTPADWARHAGKSKVEQYLREQAGVRAKK